MHKMSLQKVTHMNRFHLNGCKLDYGCKLDTDFYKSKKTASIFYTYTNV